jgi:hypothetical protein
VPRRSIAAGGAALLLAWAVVAAASLRLHLAREVTLAGVPVTVHATDDGTIEDERRTWVALAGRRNPVTVDDFLHGPASIAGQGRDARRLVRAGGDRLRLFVDPYGLEPARDFQVSPGWSHPVTVEQLAIGVFSVAAGTEVYVLEHYGLADVLGSHTRLPDGSRAARPRPGHEKRLDLGWALARMGTPDQKTDPVPGDVLEAARRALGCEGLAELLRAVSEPLTPGRFAANLTGAWSRTRLRYSGDPAVAARELCREERSARTTEVTPSAANTTSDGSAMARNRTAP